MKIPISGEPCIQQLTWGCVVLGHIPGTTAAMPMNPFTNVLDRGDGALGVAQVRPHALEEL